MSGTLRQIHTALAVGFIGLVMGSFNVWPSYTASLYTSNTTTPLAAPMTQAEESLLGSLPFLGAMLGTAITGPLLMLGRRNGGVVSTLPIVLSWAIVSISSLPSMVLVARFLGGIGGGVNLVLSPIFISEVSEASIRGALVSVPFFLNCLGTLFSYLVGWFFPYKTIIWLNIVISALSTLLISVVVESPVYLLMKKREEDARISIAKYRGVPVSSMIVTDELSRLKKQVMPSQLVADTDTDAKTSETEKENLNTDEAVPENIQSMSPIKLLFISPASRRAFVVVFTVVTMQALMGVIPVQVYAKTVFTQTDPDRADMFTVLFALILFCGCGVSTFIADMAGRRILLIASSVLVCICMTALGFLVRNKDVPAWVTVVLLLVYCFSFMLGAGTIPYVLMAEVFISEVQSIASMIIIEWVWFLNFFTLGVFPYMLSMLGIHGSFFVFACTSFINAMIGYFIVPETKGLSNVQIQDLLVSRKK